MQQDSLAKIKEAEEISDKEMQKLEEELNRRKEEIIKKWKAQMALLKKEYEDKIANLKESLKNNFKEIDKEVEEKNTKEKETLKNRAKNNFDSFFSEVTK